MLDAGAAARKMPADPFKPAGMTPAAAIAASVTASLKFGGDPQFLMKFCPLSMFVGCHGPVRILKVMVGKAVVRLM